MVGILALLVLAQSGGVDMMTQSALTGILQEVRSSASFYESATQRFGRNFPFAELARTERRHERLVLGLFKTYAVTIPALLKARPVTGSLQETLRRSITLERGVVRECSHYLGFVKPQDMIDIFTVIKVTARDLHLPALQKKLGGDEPPRLTPTQVRQLRDKVNKGR